MRVPRRATARGSVDYRPIDQRIWEEELEDFVPASVVDAHAHCLRDAHLSCLKEA